MALDPVLKVKLLVEFISADLGQVVSSGVEEHAVEQALRAVNGQRLAGTDLPVELQQAVLIVVGGIFAEAGQELGLLAEQVDDLRVGAVSQGTDENRHRNLSGPVHAHVKYIVGIRLVLQPCAPVGDHSAGEKLFADLIMADSIVDTGGTHQLADDYPLCSVDHEGARVRHKRKVAHKNLVLVDLVLVLVAKSDLNL